MPNSTRNDQRIGTFCDFLECLYQQNSCDIFIYHFSWATTAHARIIIQLLRMLIRQSPTELYICDHNPVN
jgi:hypothetical protein